MNIVEQSHNLKLCVVVKYIFESFFLVSPEANLLRCSTSEAKQQECPEKKRLAQRILAQHFISVMFHCHTAQELFTRAESLLCISLDFTFTWIIWSCCGCLWCVVLSNSQSSLSSPPQTLHFPQNCHFPCHCTKTTVNKTGPPQIVKQGDKGNSFRWLFWHVYCLNQNKWETKYQAQS